VNAAIGIYLRELGRIGAGSATVIALPLGLVWAAWVRYLGIAPVTNIDPTDAAFRSTALVLAALTVWAAAPALASERAAGTSALWAISPVRPGAVLAGKVAALLTYAAAAGALLLVPPLWSDWGGADLAWPRLGAGAVGLLVLCLVAASVTLLASALARHFSTAFVWGLGLLGLWVWGNDVLARAAAALGTLLPHSLAPALAPTLSGAFDPVAGWGGKAVLYPLFLGWVDLGAVAGMTAAAVVALVACHQVVASERWRS
jgi:ABC-2 family transporter protein